MTDLFDDIEVFGIEQGVSRLVRIERCRIMAMGDDLDGLFHFCEPVIDRNFELLPVLVDRLVPRFPSYVDLGFSVFWLRNTFDRPDRSWRCRWAVWRSLRAL